MQPTPQADIDLKYGRLAALLRSMKRVVVAFSGGVDSTFLLHAVRENLPQEDVLAVTAVSPILPRQEKADALELARQIGVRHLLWESGEMSDPDFTANPKDKCYLCKRGRFKKLVELAREEGFAYVLDGENADDAGDFRPGSRAARELGVRSPLKEADLTKSDIRRLSKRLGLATWDKPASACLASRIAYHHPITAEKLAQVDAGEAFIRALAVRGQVRVRHHGDLARLEISPEAVERLMAPNLRREIVDHFKALGFLFVALDLEGYSTGSLNRAVVGDNRRGDPDGHQIP